MSAGSAAINYAILTIARAGSNVVSVPQLYGGTYTLFAHMLPGLGVDVRFARRHSPSALEQLIDDKTAAVFFETIGNPAGNIADIEAITRMAHRHGVPVIVDATVSTPVLTQAHRLGADIVVHSMTKYIGGHGNSLGGMIVDSGNFPWAEHPDKYPMLTEPEPAYHGVVLHGDLRPGRLHRPCAHRAAAQHRLGHQPAQRLPDPAGDRDAGPAHGAARRERHGGGRAPEGPSTVAWVSYAGLPDSPYYQLAQKYTKGRPSGLLSFGVKGGFEPGVRFYDALKIFKRLVNIGDVRSLAAHPASTTHRQMTEAEQSTAKVSPDIIRLSVGIEHIDDILEDIDQALSAAVS